MHAKETSIYYALLAGIVVLLVLMAFFVTSLVRYHRRKVEHEHRKLRRQFNYLEEERARIAVDLHDDLGGLLTAAKYHLQTIEGRNQKEQHRILKAESHIHSIMEKLRIITHNLMPAILERKGLEYALHDLVNNTMSVGDIKIQFSSTALELSPRAEIHVYRIVQEMLTNAIKHSGASLITIEATQKRAIFSLIVRDNGKGFRKNEVWREGGRQGMQNIVSRVDTIGGELYLNTAPGMGVEYQLKLQAHGRKTHQSNYRR